MPSSMRFLRVEYISIRLQQLALSYRKLVCMILQMAGKTTVEQTASSTSPVGVTVTPAENERFTLARQDASVHSSKSPLGR